MNALDNLGQSAPLLPPTSTSPRVDSRISFASFLDARRHVNKMCLAADVPLIESGTQGYVGQVQPIKKDETECFDCTGQFSIHRNELTCASQIDHSPPVCSETRAQDFCSLHNQKYSLDGSPLHCLGQELPVSVRFDTEKLVSTDS